MSLAMEIFFGLLIDTILGFIFYLTGCLILKIITLGQLNVEFKDFAAFKASKSAKRNFICLLGISFYIILIFLVAYLNN